MKATRIIIGVIAPAPLGAIFLSLMFLAPDLLTSSEFRVFSSIMEFIRMILKVTFLAYIIIGIPSITYSFLMEFVINPYIKNNHWVVFISTLFGVVTGLLFPLSIIAGGITGMILGLILRRSYLVEQDKLKE